MRVRESILDDSTVIDIECDCVVRCVLISEVHSVAELCRGILKSNKPHIGKSIVIGIPQDQMNGRQVSRNAAWQVSFEDGVGVTMATEEHPCLDTAICDREYCGQQPLWIASQEMAWRREEQNFFGKALSL